MVEEFPMWARLTRLAPAGGAGFTALYMKSSACARVRSRTGADGVIGAENFIKGRSPFPLLDTMATLDCLNYLLFILKKWLCIAVFH